MHFPHLHIWLVCRGQILEIDSCTQLVSRVTYLMMYLSSLGMKYEDPLTLGSSEDLLPVVSAIVG